MKRILTLLAAVLTLTACVKHDEIEFSGTVVDVRMCNSTIFDQNPGYVVQLEYPDSIGGVLQTDEGKISNLIVLYEPDRRVMVKDHIHGTFYLDDKYSKANCSLRWENYDLPEGVFLKVSVD